MEENVSIGTLLRNAREKRKLKLEDIASKTKININVLRALEEDDVKNLPNIAYLKGFVRNYAKAVGVEHEVAQKSLQETLQIKDDKPKPVVQAIEVPKEESFEEQELKENFISIAQSFFNKKILLGVSILVLIIITLKMVVNWFAELNFESNNIAQIDQNKDKTHTAPSSVIKDESANILEMEASKKFAQSVQNDKDATEQAAAKEAASKQAAEEAAAKQAEVAAAKKAAEEAAAKKAAEEATKTKTARTDGKLPFRTFSPAAANTFSIVENAPQANDPEILPNNFKAAIEADKENVFIHATEDDTWISYKSDDDPIKRFVLKQGRKVLIKGKVIRLFMGNYKVATLFYNNKLIEIKPTRSGVRSIIFPQSVAKDYMLPLFPVHNGKSYTPEEYIENMAPQEE